VDTSSELKLTYEDYLSFPADGRRHEIVDGEHFVTPAPNLRHQAIVLYLGALLRSHVLRQGAGWVGIAPLDVVLGPTDVVQPDLLYVRPERTAILEANRVAGAPDLVVEIVSEATRRHDEVTKRRLYARSGVGEYWVIDPVLDVVKVYRPGLEGYERVAELAAERGELLSTPLLPGLEISLTELFAQR
jgi:Uma2 family endonuclease